jgi:hypothetical protein
MSQPMMMRLSQVLGKRRMAAVPILTSCALIWASPGASGESHPVLVKSNGPSKLAVSNVTPANGATISGSITWQVTVSGAVPARVEFAVDGTVKWTETLSPYYYAGTTNGLNTTTMTDGSHTLTATAYPSGKGPTAKSSTTVTVHNQVVVPPASSDPPAVSGNAQEGQTLTSSTGSWSGTSPLTYAYQWLRCDPAGANCAPITGATANSYLLGSSDVGSTARSRVTASNTAGSASAQSSPTEVVVSAPIPPSWSLFPAVSGNAQEGQTLTSSTGSWSGTSPLIYAYQWLRCDPAGANCAPITGAIAQSYPVGPTDVGATLRSRVTASNTAGSASAQSTQTEVVVAAPQSSSSIYWGALMDGTDTYTYLYGGSWSDAPWDANTWGRFESNAGKRVSVVHWGMNQPPWVKDFNWWVPSLNLVQHAGDLNAVDMSTGSVRLRDIANGVYDASIRTWMQQAAAWGHPFFFILDVEMNGTWEPYSPGVNGNTSADFVNMWRRFHDLAVQAGATNITWVWAPNVDPGNIFTPYSQVYPGDAYVDWTGLDGFNRNGTQTFSWLYGASYNRLLQIAPSKPIMITQIGSVEGGSGKAAWITDALTTQLPQNFPRIKALVWFNWRNYQAGSWWPWEIESSASSQAAFKTAISSAYYAPGGSYANLLLRTKITPP